MWHAVPCAGQGIGRGFSFVEARGDADENFVQAHRVDQSPEGFDVKGGDSGSFARGVPPTRGLGGAPGSNEVHSASSSD